MGYYTKHRIRIINEYNTEENLEELKDYIEKISGYSFSLSGGVIYDDGIKWYDCKDNMHAVSRFLPDYEIQVKGKGENGEVWEIICKDGDYYDKSYTTFTDSESESEYESNSEEEIYIEINKQKYKE